MADLIFLGSMQKYNELLRPQAISSVCCRLRNALGQLFTADPGILQQ